MMSFFQKAQSSSIKYQLQLLYCPPPCSFDDCSDYVKELIVDPSQVGFSGSDIFTVVEKIRNQNDLHYILDFFFLSFLRL